MWHLFLKVSSDSPYCAFVTEDGNGGGKLHDTAWFPSESFLADSCRNAKASVDAPTL